MEIEYATTIFDLLKVRAVRTPNATAIIAPERKPLTYALLLAQVEHVARSLNAMGIGREDRVAITLSNGPELAVAFLAVGACAISAPLNPAYRESEFNFYLTNLRPKALLVQADLESPARAVARARHIPVVEVTPALEAAAGIFELAGRVEDVAVNAGMARPGDLAALLFTSGTTFRPKLVPLTRNDLCASGQRARVALWLDERDRCLNIMPLFHAHGLLAALLSSLMAGGSVVCAPGFHVPKFFEWLEEFCPTWYTAVPTMHQSILRRAALNRRTISRCPLRVIRSSSAPLPAQVMAELESVFKAPVIETYGLTEAFQMTANPLPPRPRKAGSVGVPHSPDHIAIMDPVGNLLPCGASGEIVIHESQVMQGYRTASMGDERVFTDGWFRTGDQGCLDADGYLFVQGRFKEIINRGGEKISPYEIEQTLLDYPAVAQAVVFAVPDLRVGEEIAAAIVLREGAVATASEIGHFAAGRLSDFKVPNRIIFLDEIPKNSTGKPQRNGLAKLLGLTEARSQMTVEYLAPRTPSEIKLAQIWAEVLGIDELGIHDNFFDLGGHSLAATRIVSLVLKQFQLEIPLRSLFESPTIAQMGEVIAGYQGKQIDVGELDRLFTEIETMTEGEAQKLLALSEKTISS